jgi:hypothetical protein
LKRSECASVRVSELESFNLERKAADRPQDGPISPLKADPFVDRRHSLRRKDHRITWQPDSGRVPADEGQQLRLPVPPAPAGVGSFGGIGVSGGTADQDEPCAQAGIDAVKNTLK